MMKHIFMKIISGTFLIGTGCFIYYKQNLFLFEWSNLIRLGQKLICIEVCFLVYGQHLYGNNFNVTLTLSRVGVKHVAELALSMLACLKES